MNLESLIAAARDLGASDLHLEPGMPAALRIRGELRFTGEPVGARLLQALAQDLIAPEQWEYFVQRRSHDFSKTIHGVRCRVNVLHTARGIGFAIRLLASFQATLEKLNLHPELKRLLAREHGLILVSGPTGSGKSTTLAALIQEINLTEARHIVTIEHPIEYNFRPQRSFIRQREVGRDTPSFEQALLDSLREDPDVLMVGEMRDPETMRLTLNAAETGHLVLATVHSATCAEALQRVVGAFPAEIQNSIAAQLADCLVAVISQRLQFRADLNIRVPECEIAIPTNPVKAFIRNREFFRIISSMETGAEHGMWTFARYRAWLEKRSNFYVASAESEAVSDQVVESGGLVLPRAAPEAARKSSVAMNSELPAKSTAMTSSSGSGRIEIEPVDGGLDALLKKLE